MRLRPPAATLVALLSCTHMLAAQQAQPPAQPDTAEVVIAWIQQNAIPIGHVEAGHGFSDLQPLKQILKDVRIVGLGEATHGTREFFQVKHRLLEFLVREMGFTAFAIEAAYSDSQPINDYVLRGEGDRARVLTGQGYVAWDTEEFAAMLDWMRAYNRTVPESKKVRFYGVDLFRNEVGRRAVLAYLRKLAPEKVSSTDSVFQVLAAQEAKWPLWDTATVVTALPRLQALAEHLTENKSTFVKRSSATEFENVSQYLRVMVQCIMQIRGTGGRTRYMADNLTFLLERERPGTKIVFWAHNGHVAKVRAWWPSSGNYPFMGNHLRQKYGDQYYAFALELGQGSFQFRVFPPPAELKVGTVPPAPEGSLPSYLSRTEVGNLILNLRAPAGNPIAEHWFSSPRATYSAGWGSKEAPAAPSAYTKKNFQHWYDGIIFIENTTAVRPTQNALRITAERKGF